MSAVTPGGPETVQTLVGSRLIRMADKFEAPYRSALVSMPQLKSETQLSIMYSEAEV